MPKYTNEELLISSVLRTKDFVTPAEWSITEAKFHAFDEEWKWIQEYVKRNARTPSKMAFKSHFPDFTVVAADDVSHFCFEVNNDHRRHLLIEALDRAAQGIEDESDLEMVAEGLASNLLKLQKEMDAKADLNMLTDWQGVYAHTVKQVERANSTGRSGIPIGIESIDDITGGAQPGELWILGARLGQGKSWVLMHAAVEAILAGYTVQFDALEMNSNQVAGRVHSLLAARLGKQVFPSSSLHRGMGVDLRAWKSWLEEAGDLISGKLFVNDSTRGRMGINNVMGQIERNQPDLTIIDYVGLMRRSNQDWQGMAELIGDLKGLSGSSSSAIFAATQLNREAESRGKSPTNYEPPSPATIALADAIGQDADAFISVGKLSKRVIKGKLGKYRHGGDERKFFLFTDYDRGIIQEMTGQKAIDVWEKDKDEAIREEEDGRRVKANQPKQARRVVKK